MEYTPINLYSKLSKFNEHWSPKIIGQMNDYHVKVVKIQGDFVWHSHSDTDEIFMVIDGSIRIDFRDGSVIINEGELYIVPKMVEHKPFAEHECKLILIEKAGTVNTGEAGGELTADNNAWI